MAEEIKGLVVEEDNNSIVNEIEPKAEEPKAEEPKAEEPKAEEPKAEEPKAEKPKAETVESKKSTKILVIVSVIIAIIAIVCMVLVLGNKESGIETLSSDINVGELRHMTLAEKNALAQQIIDDSMFEISIETAPVYKDGKLGIGVENRDINKIDIRVAVLNGDGEEIYYSDIIKPGTYIEWATIEESKITEGKAQVRYDFLENGKVYQSSFVDISIKK